MTDSAPRVASEAIFQRIVSVDMKLERAEHRGDRAEVDRLTAVRKAYVIDLMDTLNTEGSMTHRRAGDHFKAFTPVTTEEWVEARKSGRQELAS